MVKMVDLSREQTYAIVAFILKNNEFSQGEIANSAGVSKAWVSKVFKRLGAKGYIKKAGGRYACSKPVELVSLFPLFRSMQNNLIESFSLDLEREKLLSFLKGKKVVLCTTTALQFHSSYFRDPSTDFYTGDKSILKEFKKIDNGLLRVNLYRADLCLEADVEKRHGFEITDPVRTVIDLFCDNKAYAAEKLVKRLWE